jgi:hypothetical protein
MLKWLKRIVVSVILAVVLAVGGIYIASVLRLGRTYDTPLVAFDAASFHMPIAESERRTRALMCVACHDKAGHVLFKADGVGTLVAPNLTRLVSEYSDSELERLIRKGIKKDSTGVIAMHMPISPMRMSPPSSHGCAAARSSRMRRRCQPNGVRSGAWRSPPTRSRSRPIMSTTGPIRQNVRLIWDAISCNRPVFIVTR